MPDETRTQALKRKYDELQVMNTTYKEIYEFLQVTSKADAEGVISQIRSGIDAETMGYRIRKINHLLQAATVNKKPVNMPCFQQLLSWKLCRPSSSDKKLPDEDESSTKCSVWPLKRCIHNFAQMRINFVGFSFRCRLNFGVTVNMLFPLRLMSSH